MDLVGPCSRNGFLLLFLLAPLPLLSPVDSNRGARVWSTGSGTSAIPIRRTGHLLLYVDGVGVGRSGLLLAPLPLDDVLEEQAPPPAPTKRGPRG
jgi:hypothetical protein